MINALLQGMFSLILKLVSILLIPINTIINTMLPDFNNYLSSISDFFNLVFGSVAYSLDFLLISSETISFLILFWIFKLTFPLLVDVIKLAIKWYNSLKV